MITWLKYVIALVSAFALMLAFRTLALSIHGVTGDGLAPLYQNGDRLLINRCSYGMRVKGSQLLPYSRLMRQPVKRGDIVAFLAPDNQSDGLMIARCIAIPGDTIPTNKGVIMVPGVTTCDKIDYYWLEALNPDNPADSRHLGLIPESHIVGRVVSVLYHRKNTMLP